MVRNEVTDKFADEDDCKELLLSDEETEHVNDYNKTRLNRRSHIRLLLIKGSLFMLGISFVVGACVASRYQLPESLVNGNFTDCMSDEPEVFSSYDDTSSSTILFPSPTPFIAEWS